MHTEKQEIFDKYAKSKGYISWVSLIIHHNNRSLDYDDHIFTACGGEATEADGIRIRARTKIFNI